VFVDQPPLPTNFTVDGQGLTLDATIDLFPGGGTHLGRAAARGSLHLPALRSITILNCSAPSFKELGPDGSADQAAEAQRDYILLTWIPSAPSPGDANFRDVGGSENAELRSFSPAKENKEEEDEETPQAVGKVCLNATASLMSGGLGTVSACSDETVAVEGSVHLSIVLDGAARVLNFVVNGALSDGGGTASSGLFELPANATLFGPAGQLTEDLGPMQT